MKINSRQITILILVLLASVNTTDFISFSYGTPNKIAISNKFYNSRIYIIGGI